MLFILISDIDKSYKSWYEWIPYNQTKKIKTNFVSQLKKMGEVFIPKPNFVNFRKYADYDNNTGYGRNINFTLEDLEFENYAKWIYEQIDIKYRKNKKNIIVIGLEQGCHHAKFFAQKYYKDCKGVFILGNRILTKENYEKINNKAYRDSLKKYFGKEWKKYTIENIDNKHLKEILDNLDKKEKNKNQDYVMYLNGLVKIYTRSQYDKIKKAKIPSFIYSYVQQVDDKKLEIDRKYMNNDNKVNFYYLDDDSPYFIYGPYKNEIIERVKCFMNK